ncbi:NUDIX domain-containing protein [Fibrisoma montanum]|uniref:NUDIX domain-containing protein n=1 Tax=Fibrisoma montanum TaxID=2305895 RepID=A0A418M209_9BACT|nr:NUDIX hydrolase [Fibrisoma montanum]RIV19694.1 NUDIX domain-containing protein [Fibrisoma montanum]
MHRQLLLSLLREYQNTEDQALGDHERAMVSDTITFVEQHPDCFERSLAIGHVTGSAWIVSPDGQQVVLVHHRKLDRWLQPGGHADGDPDLANVALREAQEETGLTSVRLASPAIYDVDIHLIPERKEEPAHFHYDIRFKMIANPDESFRHTPETKDIHWVHLSKIEDYTHEESVIRMVNKKK